MELSTTPAVAIPEGRLLRADIPRINPTMAAMIPIKTYLPVKIPPSETMPKTMDAIATPSV